MAKILFAWELGAGIGHIMPIQGLAQQLRQHDCYAIVSDHASAEKLLGSLDITLHCAPKYVSPKAEQVNALCFSDVLYNSGYSDPDILAPLITQWQKLFDQIKPDIVLFDHSPTALVAAQGSAFKTLVYGSGFICPPPSQPCGLFFPKLTSPQDKQRMLATEAIVLRNINDTLRAINKPLIKQISDLYHSQDQLLLTSYPEFDHYIGRQLDASHYTGITSSLGRKKPCWPKSNGKRIFAYLMPSDALPELLRTLQQSQQSVIIYSNNINPEGLASFQSPTMHFEYEPLDLSAIAEEADFAIVNGGHNTSAELLIRGIPLIIIPLHREQQIFSYRVEELGATLSVQPGKRYHERMVAALNAIISDARYKQAAHRLKNKFAGTSPFSSVERLVKAIEVLLGGND